MAKFSAEERKALRESCEADLATFVAICAPHEVWGSVHLELFRWWSREGGLDNQLVLLPRDHKKSKCVAYRVAWWLTNHPDTTVLYVSATANLAEKQLKAIKDILTSDIYRYLWPEMINENENKREKWSMDAICIDHPKRKEEGIRDDSIKAAGITANVTGLHCAIAVLDDVVVPDNAYTESGRDQVRGFYSQLSSIESTGAKEWCVGTRYHPADLYRDLIEMNENFYDSATEEDVEQPVYEVFERVVETNGEFLWPKQRRADGKVFGFDDRELARKKAKYLDITQFYSQYYNNPNAVELSIIDRSRFNYYERSKLENVSGTWYVGDKDLTVYAAMDFAYSVTNTSDYTAIVVVGVDENSNYYVLDIDRFKTNKISVMYDHAEKIYRKWKFKRLRAEAVAAQRLIIQQFKDFMRGQDIVFSIDEYNPPKTMNKQERIAATLEPRYQNGQIYHYLGGNCQILEEELLMNNPEHDDVKDALAAVIEIAKPGVSAYAWKRKSNVVSFNKKYGGVAYA